MLLYQVLEIVVLWPNKGALDFTIQGMSGIMSITGEKGGTPYKVGFAITDILTGQMLWNSILAALLARDKDPLK